MELWDWVGGVVKDLSKLCLLSSVVTHHLHRVEIAAQDRAGSDLAKSYYHLGLRHTGDFERCFPSLTFI